MPGAWSEPSHIALAGLVPLKFRLWQTRGGARSSKMPSDVCEGCRRLRKKCDKDDCVLIFSLEQLYQGDKLAQGNVTSYLAKAYGRKKFLNLLGDRHWGERPDLFASLLRESIGRKINPVKGIEGLIASGREGEVDAAIQKLKEEVSTGSSSSSDISGSVFGRRRRCRESSVARSRCRTTPPPKHKRERDEDEDPTTPEECIEDAPPRKKHEFDLNLQPKEEYESEGVV